MAASMNQSGSERRVYPPNHQQECHQGAAVGDGEEGMSAPPATCKSADRWPPGTCRTSRPTTCRLRTTRKMSHEGLAHTGRRITASPIGTSSTTIDPA